MPSVRLALVGDYNSAVAAHRAIPEALALAGRELGVEVEPVWVHTTNVDADPVAQFAEFQGTWCIPASPYANTQGALSAIRIAREMGRPFLGTCGGFQHALLEYAHSVLGMRDAGHTETDPGALVPLISPLACGLVEQMGTVFLLEGSRMRTLYGQAEATEGYHCRYGLNPAFESVFAGTGMRITARDAVGEVRGVELAGHPFFVATLFQPERSALHGKGHPIVTGFVAAAQFTAPGV